MDLIFSQKIGSNSRFRSLAALRRHVGPSQRAAEFIFFEVLVRPKGAAKSWISPHEVLDRTRTLGPSFLVCQSLARRRLYIFSGGKRKDRKQRRQLRTGSRQLEFLANNKKSLCIQKIRAPLTQRASCRCYLEIVCRPHALRPPSAREERCQKPLSAPN